MLSARPKSNWEDENGLINLNSVNAIPENPALVTWETKHK